MRIDLYNLPRRVRRALPGRSTGLQTGAQHMLYHGCNLLVFVPTMWEQHGGPETQLGVQRGAALMEC